MRPAFLSLLSAILFALPTACSGGQGSAASSEAPPAAAANEAPAEANASQPAAAANQGAVRTITPAELHETKASVKLLVDVRTPGEFTSGHVPGAVNIPVAELADRLAELEPHKDGEIHLICQSGGRSARAAAMLAQKGYRVVDVEGGTHAWRANGYDVE